ncbi:GAF domain-containing protein [Xylophilus sp. GOD-11R]|uniref:GAF domain-containing protein n=1 Tax=Xylophilus sp. GOD-11R TaxID=3089814 RepID=UPI00298CA986|nr:GAF domain-containing protein [Xylophilus sp. GOD-11R]WPB55166.1 GAF domain-containing protein [Xylophilus sp. GOD-11R]
MNYLDRRRGARGMRAAPSATDAQFALDRFGRLAILSAAEHDEATMCRLIESSLVELCGARVLVILRWGATPDTFEHVRSTHPAIHPSGEFPGAPDDLFLQRILRATEAEHWPDARAAGSAFLACEQLMAQGCESALSVPIRFGGRTLGAIVLMHKAHWYQPGHIVLCQPFAAMLAADWAASRH